MRILRVESSRNWGGQEDRLLLESAWLLRHGHQVAIICDPQAALLPKAQERNVPVFPYRMRRALDPAASLYLYRMVRRWNAELVHTNSSKDSWAAFPLHLLGVPVVRSRNISLLHQKFWARLFIYRYGCRRVICSAQFIADVLHRHASLPSERLDVIGEGVDVTKFHPGVDGSPFRKEFGISPDAPLFGVVAMLRGEKGQRYFLRAALEVLKRHPEARFVLVGGGTGRKNFENKLLREIQDAFPTGNAPVILTGFRKDIPSVMAALTALVVPSLHDAQTLVIPQAFATRRTVIGSRVGGIPENVRHEENGLLVEPKDEKGLAAAMIRLIEDPSLREKLEAAAYRLAEKELSFDHRMEQVLESYRKTLSS